MTNPEEIAGIAGKAMLVSLEIKTWTAVTVDEDATQAGEQPFQASTGSGSYRKRLIDRDAMAEVRKAARAARETHNKMTLPWSDKGQRLLPTKSHGEYVRHMVGLAATFDAEAQNFIQAYASHVEAARHLLGGLFKPNEYPSPAEIQTKFEISYHVAPLAIGSDFRLDLPQAELERMAAERDAEVAASLVAAQRDLYARLHTSMASVVEALNRIDSAQEGNRVQLRQTLFDSMADAATAAANLNVTGDAKLSELADLANRMAGTVTREQLRDDDALRRNFKVEAQRITAAMAAFV